MILAIESIVLCALFTLMVYIMSRNPIKTLFTGTEDMVDEYHNYWFHITGFFIGEGLALVVCALSALVVQFVL